MEVDTELSFVVKGINESLAQLKCTDPQKLDLKI